MQPSYQGIYEDGVVRFPGPVPLPNHTPVTVVAQSAPQEQAPLGCDSDELFEILSHRYDTGETDLAARVDEIDP